MANNSSTPVLPCEYVLVDPDFIPIAAIRATVGTISAAACVFLVILVLLLQKYKYSLCQRLILYLAVAAFFHSLSYPLARVNYYTPRKLLSPYCNFGGFFNLYTSWIEVLALTCLTLGSFINGVLQKHLPRWAELLYIGLPYVLPLFWCWIPFIDHSFGSGSAWCDIRTLNVDCSQFILGAVLRFIIWYIPLAVILIFLFVFALLVFFRTGWALKSEGSSAMKQWQKEDLKEIRYLVIYPIVYLLLNIFSFINRLDIAIQENEALLVFYYLHILSSPLRGAVIALVFAFDPDTRKRLANPKTLCVSNRVREYSIRTSDECFDASQSMSSKPIQ